MSEAPEFKRENKSKIPNLKLIDKPLTLGMGLIENRKSKIENCVTVAARVFLARNR